MFCMNQRRITSPARNYNLIDHKRLRGNFNVSLCNSRLALAVIIWNEFVPLALWCLIYDWLLKRQQSFMFVSIFDGFARKCIKMSHKLSDFTGNCTLGVGNDISLSWISSIALSRDRDSKTFDAMIWCNEMKWMNVGRFTSLIKRKILFYWEIYCMLKLIISDNNIPNNEDKEQ